MIHLDTNFLIAAVYEGTPAAMMKNWILAGEDLATSAIAWAEFLNGPVGHAQIQKVNYLIEDRIVSFGVVEAAKAAELFNQSGRKRGSQTDCFIAATAICSAAPLATQNRRDFTPFLKAGLRLA